jgi:hypothetical protein
MKTCLDCIHHDRCDVIFDGLLSNRDNKPCDQFDDVKYYAKLPTYVGQEVCIPWVYISKKDNINIVKLDDGKVSGLQQKADGSWKIRVSNKRRGTVADYTIEEFTDHIFFDKAAAEKYIEEKVKEYTNDN